MFLGVAAVHVQGVELQVCFGEVAIEQLVDRCLGPWVALLVHLVQQADPHLLCKLLGIRAGRNRLGQVVAALSDGVDACIDAHPEGAAG